GRALGAGEASLLDGDAAAGQGAGGLQARGRAEQAVEFPESDAEIAAAGVEGEAPRPAGARHGGGDRSAESTLRPAIDAAGVGDLGAPAEAEAAEQVAPAAALEDQRLPAQVDAAQQEGAVGLPRRREAQARRGAEQAPDDAGAGAAGDRQVAVQLHTAALHGDIERAAQTRGPVAGRVEAEQVHRTAQPP